jgi:hypothetical protein
MAAVVELELDDEQPPGTGDDALSIAMTEQWLERRMARCAAQLAAMRFDGDQGTRVLVMRGDGGVRGDLECPDAHLRNERPATTAAVSPHARATVTLHERAPLLRLPRCSVDVKQHAGVRRLFSNTFSPSGSEARERLHFAHVEALSAPLHCTVHNPPSRHGFLNTVHAAFTQGLPLLLEPDHIWTLILQGVADHVHLNADALRELFPTRRDEIVVRTRAYTSWAEDALPVLCTVATHARGGVPLPAFSTTCGVRFTCAALALLDVFTGSAASNVPMVAAIDGAPPRITLMGSAEDWCALRRCAERACAAACMQWWWTLALEPLLNEFVRAFDGADNADFWRDMYHHGNEYAAHFSTGWVNYFFPYTRNSRGDAMRRAFARDSRVYFSSVGCGASRVPFVWVDAAGERRAMLLCSGFIRACGVIPSHGLTPALGWAVAHAVAQRSDEKPS